MNIMHTVDKTATSEEIIALILKNRGIGKKDEKEFLHPKLPTEYLLAEVGIGQESVNKALKRLRHARETKEKVVVYADYDVDGITGGTIMWKTLHELGFSVSPHISYRSTEGYGFSEESVNRLKEKHKPGLIITVDHGVTGEKYIAKLKKEGIDVIVLDHHIAFNGIPKSALSNLYTKIICGSAISYFIAREIAKTFEHSELLTELFLIDFPVLAGLGSVADVIPLKGATRSLATYALNNLSKVRIEGLRTLLQQTGLLGKSKHSSYDIGFILGPRINAAGRMGDALDSLRLLCTSDRIKALELIRKLEAHNKNRQQQVESHLKEAEKLVIPQKNEGIYLVISSLFEEGTVGLIAAKLAEKYYRPVLVGTLKNGIIKGSARSVPGVHITNCLKRISTLLISFGGHERAGGFSFPEKNVNEIRMELQREGRKILQKSLLTRTFLIDIDILLSSITLSLATKLEMLEPYGEGNEKPVFLSKNVIMSNIKRMGSTGKHAQFIVSEPGMNKSIRAVYFNDNGKTGEIGKEEIISLLYVLEVNRWKGEEPVMHIKGIVRSGGLNSDTNNV